MKKVLDQIFFDRPTLNVAEELLGKYLVRSVKNKIIAGIITEVEAYEGFRDKASHAHRGITERNKPMFGPAGCWYIYLVYGAHWMLNITTGPKKYPAAILIREIFVPQKNKLLRFNGPGKLTKFLRINKAMTKRVNGKPAIPKAELWVEDRNVKIAKRAIKKGPRIGVDYAGEWKHKPWRLYINMLQ